MKYTNNFNSFEITWNNLKDLILITKHNFTVNNINTVSFLFKAFLNLLHLVFTFFGYFRDF